MVPPKEIPLKSQATNRRSSNGPQRDQSQDRKLGQPPKLPNRTSSISKQQSSTTSDLENHNLEEKEGNSKASPNLGVKSGVSRLPPQNVKPMLKSKSSTNPKLAKPPKSSKPLLQPIESMEENYSRLTIKSEGLGSRLSQKPAEDRSNRSHGFDAQVYKLLDMTKRLTETNAKLSQENSFLKAEIGQFRANLPLMVQDEDWSKQRDRILKDELLRLRAENYKLRSSSQLNERFGDLLSRLARDSELYCNQCLEAVEAEEGSEKKAFEVLSDVTSCVFKLNTSLQSCCRDYTNLKEEQGTLNTREWDCSFGKAEVHSTQQMTDKVCRTLLELETSYADALNQLKMVDVIENNILKSFRQLIVESSKALLEKSMILNSFSPTKKTYLELKKKLKGLNGLNISEELSNLQTKHSENIQNFSNLDAELHARLMSSDLESFFKHMTGSDPKLSICRMSGMLLSLDKICASNKQIKKTEAIEAKLSVYLKQFDRSIAEWVRELINFLDRTGLCHEVYLGYRHKILNALDEFFMIQPADSSGWTEYLEELRETARSCLNEFGKA